LEITTDIYNTSSTEAIPLPQLDVDADGFSNLVERQAGSRPADDQDIPLAVLVLYNDRAPVIDGQFDSIWNTAQFRDQDLIQLGIGNLLVDTGIVDTAMSSDFKWAAMHDGSHLYIMVFVERGINQTLTADSGALVYEDDSVDIYWDGNNSKGASYDGVDDFHIIVGLLGGEGEANNSSANDTRIQVGDRSSPFDVAAIQYAVCVCVCVCATAISKLMSFE
jgi:hypothetical protein